MNTKDLVVILLIVGTGVLGWLAFHQERPKRYRKRGFLTGTEREFFYALRRALPECIVCPQVSISALIEPLGIGKQREAALSRVLGERALYAVFDQSMNLLTIIELDRHSKTTSRGLLRDSGLETAGIRTIRFKMRNLPSEAAIHAEVFDRNHAKAAVTSKASAVGDIPFQHVGNPWQNTAGLQP